MNNQITWDYRDPYEWMERTAKNNMPPLMISVAITGGSQGKEANPNLPETVEEQVEAAYEAYQEGAVSVHAHMRNPEHPWQSVNDIELFSRFNEEVRKRCPGMIVNNSTSGSPAETKEEKIVSVLARCKPDMASLNPGPFMFERVFKERKAPLKSPRDAQENDLCIPVTYGDVRYWAKMMKENGVKPEIEVFNQGQFWTVNDLISKKLIDPPYVMQFVMGFQTGAYPCPQNVFNMIENAPKDTIFFVPATGPYQLPLNVLSIIMGGHVRVGLEDNVYYRKGELAQSNAQQVARIRRIAEEMNRPLASVAQAREMMGLTPAQ